MTPEEHDLQALHEAQTKEYENFSHNARTYLCFTGEDLKAAGHESIGAALLYATQQHAKRLAKLIADHVKKWPDK